MRIGCLSAVALSTTIVPVICGCTPPVKSEEASVTLNLMVDMPKDQTLQFLKQSASTLKLNPVSVDSPNSITAGQAKATVTGADQGPVTVVIIGKPAVANQWGRVVTDKLPTK